LNSIELLFVSLTRVYHAFNNEGALGTAELCCLSLSGCAVCVEDGHAQQIR